MYPSSQVSFPQASLPNIKVLIAKLSTTAIEKGPRQASTRQVEKIRNHIYNIELAATRQGTYIDELAHETSAYYLSILLKL